jgi:integrase-like protein
MFNVPNAVVAQYVSILKKNEIVDGRIGDYTKWLRYYCDFCDKYPVSEVNSERVRLFCEKLREKRQPEEQRNQAAHAISLYFDMQARAGSENASNIRTPGVGGIGRGKEGAEKSQSHDVSAHLGEEFTQYQANRQAGLQGGPAAMPARSPQNAGSMRVSQYCAAGYEEKSDSREWDSTLATLAAEIKVRHYSRKTLKTYANWSRRFQHFLKNKPPQELSTSDVKDYLTFLAVKCNVAASTQNQALRIG